MRASRLPLIEAHFCAFAMSGCMRSAARSLLPMRSPMWEWEKCSHPNARSYFRCAAKNARLRCQARSELALSKLARSSQPKPCCAPG